MYSKIVCALFVLGLTGFCNAALRNNPKYLSQQQISDDDQQVYFDGYSPKQPYQGQVQQGYQGMRYQIPRYGQQVTDDEQQQYYGNLPKPRYPGGEYQQTSQQSQRGSSFPKIIVPHQETQRIRLQDVFHPTKTGGAEKDFGVKSVQLH